MRAGSLLLSLTLLAVASGSARAGDFGLIEDVASSTHHFDGLSGTRLASGYGRYEGSRGHSVSHAAPLWPGSEGAPYGTYGTGANSVAVIQINRAVDAGSRAASFKVLPGATGPKIIDVESARLDRRPYGPNGLDIVYAGTTKIIRISPDFQRGRADTKDDVQLGRAEGAVEFAKLSPAERAVTVYPDPDEPVDGPAPHAPAAALPDVARIPVPMPAPEDARLAAQTPVVAPAAPAPTSPPAAAAPAGFEPWTEDWLRDCVSRYPSFDASLGTYTDEGGRRRFCTGDAAR
ncbi:BA14K family protein [Aureimonas sp. AU40]|uniref:BA14K family protein n=1 Tax=Aureimonas sp. AU40 TaxID=1637747 RepID=UPI0007836009|nr:BA14K family protein [Aureimonas sp. AU40]